MLDELFQLDVLKRGTPNSSQPATNDTQPQSSVDDDDPFLNDLFDLTVGRSKTVATHTSRVASTLSTRTSRTRVEERAPTPIARAVRAQPSVQRLAALAPAHRTPDLASIPGEFRILRPDCQAKDRLLQWRPSQSAAINPALTADDAARISVALGEAFRSSTKATYAA